LENKPNFIIIMSDDQGYGDIGCFGAEGFSTPNIDRMANEGMKFTSFYVEPACSPTRASVMTGRYAQRVGIAAPLNGPNTGLSPDEITLPEILKTEGYTSACIGKWHLGLDESMTAVAQGFDYFSGLPLSQIRHGLVSHDWYYKRHWKTSRPDGISQIEYAPDDTQFTKRCTEEAIEFIRQNKEQPFFLYLAHPMVHLEVVASEAFRGKTERGIYGDACEEIDWSVGQVLATLKELSLDENTIIVYLSDNGPWLRKGEQSGTAGPLKDGKFSTSEGGVRVPFIARWPKHIPAGQTFDGIATGMDLYTTFSHLAGAEIPQDRVIDGQNLWPVLAGTATKSPHNVHYYYFRGALQGVRRGPWKLCKPRKQKFWGLYNLEDDIGETTNVATNHPEVVAELEELLEAARADLGDGKRKGANVSPMGVVPTNIIKPKNN
jgi:arylsulfatase A-like enzyme